MSEKRPPEVKTDFNCANCTLAKNGYRPVWGQGPHKPLLMLIGEGPGLTESKTGVPFHPDAPAGELLTDLLKQVGLKREQVYLSNATRCFKPAQDAILPAQIKACHAHLAQEIEAVDPKLIILLGNAALKSVTGHEGITKARGLLITAADGRQYLPTIHPAAALPNRYPDYQRTIKQDLAQGLQIAQRDGTDLLANVNLNIVRNAEQLAQLRDSLATIDDDTLVFFDLETNSLKTPFHGIDNPVVSGMALCWRPDEVWYVVIDHRNPAVWADDQRPQVIKLVKSFLASSTPKGGQNIKYDCLWAEGYFGVRPRRVVADTMLQSHLIDPTHGIHALEKLALQVGLAGYGQELHDWLTKNECEDWTIAPLDLVAYKSMADVLACYRFHDLKQPVIEKRNQADLYYRHVVPGMWPYVAMERNGMLTDAEYLAKLEAHYEQRRDDGMKTMRELATQAGHAVPEEFNFNSNDQIGKLLSDWIRPVNTIPAATVTRGQGRDYSQFRDNAATSYLATTKSGRLSTDKGNIDALLALPNLDLKCKKFLTALLRFKADQKRLSTYIQGLRKHICPDGRVRSTYLMHGTETGRRASVNPNRQNDPVDTDVKRLYIADNDKVFVINDYSNLEVRVAAALSQDPNLIRAFAEGKDIHSYVTSMAYRMDYDRIVTVLNNADKYPKEYQKCFRNRDHCKRAMWTVLFGGGASKVALLTGLSERQAYDLVDSILTEFPGLKQMFRRLENLTLTTGRAENAFGRWRMLVGVDSKDDGIRAEALRQGRNTPIQGTAGDITLTAARKLNSYLDKNELPAELVQEVHDSLVTESHTSCLYDVIVNSRRIMEGVQIPNYPGVALKVDQIVGRHLGSKLKVSAEILELALTSPQQLYDKLDQDLNHEPKYYEAT